MPVPGAKERLLLAVLAAGAPGVVSTDRAGRDRSGTATRRPRRASRCRPTSSGCAARSSPTGLEGSTGRFVVRRGPGYALPLDRAADRRAARSATWPPAGRARLAAGRARGGRCGRCAAAVDLWRGEPYADWPDAPFADAERRRLTEVRAGAVAGLLEARLELGRHAEVLPELERLVAEDPLREDWWRLLMLALYRAGRQADALGARRAGSAHCSPRSSARDPGPALREMEAAILTQDPALELPRPTRSAAPAGGRRTPRPAPARTRASPPTRRRTPPLFHGRQRLVAGLVARLVDAPLLRGLRARAERGSPRWSGPAWCPPWPTAPCPAAETWQPLIVTPGRASGRRPRRR